MATSSQLRFACVPVRIAGSNPAGGTRYIAPFTLLEAIFRIENNAIRPL